MEVDAGATKMRAALHIYILGPFRVERGGRPIPPREWARPKDRVLLKLLAQERGHLVLQDRLLDLLWPGLTPTAAANNLHVTVSRLRKLLAPALSDAEMLKMMRQSIERHGDGEPEFSGK